MYDCLIIGAGVSGSAIAREVSKYKANVCVLEKCEDVCEGTSKANSAIISFPSTLSLAIREPSSASNPA